MTSWIRESEKLKTILELYNVEMHQKKAGPDYHRLQTMVKRSFEQNLRMKNFEARNGNYETNAVVKNQETKLREERTLGDYGQCSKGDNCSFHHDINKRAKTTQPNPSPRSSTRQSYWLDCRARITSKELAPIHSVKSGIFQSACSTSPRVNADLGKSALMRIARLKNSLAKVLKRMVTKCSGYAEKYTTIGLRLSGHGASEVDVNLTEELRHAETNPTCEIHESYCTSH